jgi:hypothetical protein
MVMERPLEIPFGMPSPEALQLATAVLRQRYMLPETMQHPQVISECIRLAYLIQAYGLASTIAAPRHRGISNIKMLASNGRAPSTRPSSAPRAVVVCWTDERNRAGRQQGGLLNS